MSCKGLTKCCDHCYGHLSKFAASCFSEITQQPAGHAIRQGKSCVYGNDNSSDAVESCGNADDQAFRRRHDSHSRPAELRTPPPHASHIQSATPRMHMGLHAPQQPAFLAPPAMRSAGTAMNAMQPPRWTCRLSHSAAAKADSCEGDDTAKVAASSTPATLPRRRIRREDPSQSVTKAVAKSRSKKKIEEVEEEDDEVWVWEEAKETKFVNSVLGAAGQHCLCMNDGTPLDISLGAAPVRSSVSHVYRSQAIFSQTFDMDSILTNSMTQKLEQTMTGQQGMCQHTLWNTFESLSWSHSDPKTIVDTIVQYEQDTGAKVFPPSLEKPRANLRKALSRARVVGSVLGVKQLEYTAQHYLTTGVNILDEMPPAVTSRMNSHSRAALNKAHAIFSSGEDWADYTHRFIAENPLEPTPKATTSVHDVVDTPCDELSSEDIDAVSSQGDSGEPEAEVVQSVGCEQENGDVHGTDAREYQMTLWQMRRDYYKLHTESVTLAELQSIQSLQNRTSGMKHQTLSDMTRTLMATPAATMQAIFSGTQQPTV